MGIKIYVYNVSIRGIKEYMEGIKVWSIERCGFFCLEERDFGNFI